MIKAQDPKKVAEAKARRKQKARQRMKRAQRKAETIFGADGLSNRVKQRQIEKLYGRELAAIRRDKNKREYRVMKKKASKAMGKIKGGRSIKMVDKRMKADKRGQKQAEKRGKAKRKLNKYARGKSRSGKKKKGRRR